MTAPSATRVLFACDGAAIPAEVAHAGWGTPLEINATGPKPSLNLKVKSLAGKVIASLDGRAQDLVRIAAACYAADQMVSRGGNDISREHWRRELCLVIPVIAWSFWSEEAPRTALTEALGFGTEDTWRFHFVPRPPEFAQMRLNFQDRPLMGLPDSVMLVSGGTDSLCAGGGAGRAGTAPTGRQPPLRAADRQLAEGTAGGGADALPALDRSVGELLDPQDERDRP